MARHHETSKNECCKKKQYYAVQYNNSICMKTTMFYEIIL